MKISAIAFLLVCLPFAFGVRAAQPPSAYAGEQTRDIKALSPEDTAALRSGKGMGLARAAELNGYPGPAHVLELAAQLDLTAEQRTRTEALRASMEAKAIPLGRALIEAERNLDRLFATKAISPESLASSLTEIGTLQAKVRGAHLETHLAQSRILTPEQTARYATLRGYSDSGEHISHQMQHKH